MPLKLRKLSERLREETERPGADIAIFVEKSIGMDTTICSRCAATLRSYADNCTAELDEVCPGFLTIERVKAAFIL